jgi:hypothetical protein
MQRLTEPRFFPGLGAAEQQDPRFCQLLQAKLGLGRAKVDGMRRRPGHKAVTRVHLGIHKTSPGRASLCHKAACSLPCSDRPATARVRNGGDRSAGGAHRLATCVAVVSTAAGIRRYTRSTQGIPKAYPRHAQGIPKTYTRHTHGIHTARQYPPGWCCCGNFH